MAGRSFAKSSGFFTPTRCWFRFCKLRKGECAFHLRKVTLCRGRGVSRKDMRVTVTHTKGLAGAKKLVDDSAAELFKGAPGTPVQIVDQEKRWEGNTMHYSFTGKM